MVKLLPFYALAIVLAVLYTLVVTPSPMAEAPSALRQVESRQIKAPCSSISISSQRLVLKLPTDDMCLITDVSGDNK